MTNKNMLPRGRPPQVNRIGILLREPWIETLSCVEEMIEKLLGIGFSHFELPQKHFFTEKEIDF